MFAFCFFVFFGENTRKKRSNILFFSGVKVSEQKKSIFLVEKNCTRKKGKIHLRNQNSFFFFFLRLSCKTFSFFFHVCFAIRIFPSCFFSHLWKQSHKKNKKKIRQTTFFFMHETENKFSQMKKKTTSVINKIWLKNFVSVSERETNIYFSLNMKLRIN